MLTEPDIDSIARAALDEAVKQARAASWAYLYDETNGEVVFYDEPKAFRVKFLTLPTIKRIVRNCDSLLDRFGIADDREPLIAMLAERMALEVIQSFGSRVHETIEDTLSDCELLSEATLCSLPGPYDRDFRKMVAEVVEGAAGKKQELLLDRLRQFSNLKVEGRGRGPQSEMDRERLRQDLVVKIETAYLKLRRGLRRVPLMREVAREIGMGGTNPKTWSNSTSQVFSNTLRKYNIDYDATVRVLDQTT